MDNESYQDFKNRLLKFNPRPEIEENFERAEHVRLKEVSKSLVLSGCTAHFTGLFNSILTLFPENRETHFAKIALLQAYEAYQTAIEVSDFPPLY